MTGRTRSLSLPRLRLPDGLSARLLLLTAAFAVAVEAMIIAPSAASFHERWLLDRIRAAELASVGVEALPYNLVEADTAQQLMEIGGVTAVAVGEEGVRRLLLRAPAMEETPDLIDLRRQDFGARLIDPWRTLFGDPDRMLRVMARPRYRSGDFVEVVAPAQPLKRELGVHLLRSLLLSLFVSAAAGGLLYLALSILILQPMQRVTRSIERFRDDPESLPGPPPTLRRDEIGRVEEDVFLLIALPIYVLLGAAVVGAWIASSRIFGLPVNYLSLWIWGITTMVVVSIVSTAVVVAGPALRRRCGTGVGPVAVVGAAVARHALDVHDRAEHGDRRQRL